MRVHTIHGIHSNGAGLTGKLAPFFRDAGLDVMVRRYGYTFETNITGAGNKKAFKVLGRLAQAAARGRVLR